MSDMIYREVFEKPQGKLICIDRDGVINVDLWRYVEHWDEFEFVPRVLKAFRLLREAGYVPIIISNQAGIGDGKYTAEALAYITQQMRRSIVDNGGALAATYFCMHGKQAGCSCRKPEIGLFVEMEKDFEYLRIDKSDVFYIGDKASDIIAGIRYGIKTCMVKTGYGEKELSLLPAGRQPTFVALDLCEAVEKIIAGVF